MRFAFASVPIKKCSDDRKSLAPSGVDEAVPCGSSASITAVLKTRMAFLEMAMSGRTSFSILWMHLAQTAMAFCCVRWRWFDCADEVAGAMRVGVGLAGLAILGGGGGVVLACTIRDRCVSSGRGGSQ
jgi:hypothetical protein